MTTQAPRSRSLGWVLAAWFFWLSPAGAAPVAGSAAAVSPIREPPAALPVRPEAMTARDGAGADSKRLYVVRRGWHIDIALAAADLEPPLSSLLAEFPDARYLSFGFGDRRYLMRGRRGVPDMLRAVWPGPGLMLVTGLRGTPAAAFGASQVIELRRSSRQAAAAQAFIWHSLVLDATAVQPAATEVARGPYDGSLYFASPLRYSAWHTCNTWAAETLKMADVPMQTAGVAFADQVWKRSRELAAAE